MPATLRYLHFDLSDDSDGLLTFDAMASATPQHLPALHDELARVLGWAHAQFGPVRGPVEDGGLWDFELTGTLESSQAQHLDFDPRAGVLHVQPAPGQTLRHTLSLTLSATPQFAQAFQTEFGLACGGD